jgi:hypothetical protein
VCIFIPILDVSLITHSPSFVHPEDPNWPGLKPVDKRINFASPAPRRTSGSLAWGKTRSSPTRKAGSLDHHSDRHSAPLVSQNDLFQRCKIEADETTHNSQGQSRRGKYDDDQCQSRSRGRESKSGKECRSRNLSAGSSKPYDMRRYLGIEQPEDRPLAGTMTKSGSYRSRAVCLSIFLPHTSIDSQRSFQMSANNNGELNVSSIDTVNRYSRTSRSSSPSFRGRLNENEKNASPSSESNSSLVPAHGPAPEEIHRATERGSRVLDLFRDLSRYDDHYTMNNK